MGRAPCLPIHVLIPPSAQPPPWQALPCHACPQPPQPQPPPSQVLFLEVAEGEGRQQLLVLEQAVRQAFAGAGLLGDDSQAFLPHVTIAKLSRLKGRRKRPGILPAGCLALPGSGFA